MSIPATNSAIDVAYWFINRADKDGVAVEDEKLQHLLFLSQLHYASAYNMEFLMPSFFVCDENGFSEPNLAVIFAQGRPFMPPKKLPEKASLFLEEIWEKYKKSPVKELAKIVKSNPEYGTCLKAGHGNLADMGRLVDGFNAMTGAVGRNNAYSDNQKKILFSQNGPVIVSKWKPRKVSDTTHKGEK